VETSAGTWMIVCAEANDINTTNTSNIGANHGIALPVRNGPENALANRKTLIRSRNEIDIFCTGYTSLPPIYETDDASKLGFRFRSGNTGRAWAPMCA
jgi:hypothetical protein